MILGFDLQPLQTEMSKDRGIGRFTQNVVSHFLKNYPQYEKKLFFNRYYDAPDIPTGSNQIQIKYEPTPRVNSITNNLIQFFNYQSNLDAVLIFSPFEGYPSPKPVITTFFDKANFLTCSIIHDLIPLHFPEQYLSDSKSVQEYYRHLKTLYNSDVILTVSQSTRLDVINSLGINPNKVFYIGEATDSVFFKIDNLSSTSINSLKKKYKINDKFVMYAGGIDFRKNIEKSIEAFSKLENDLLDDTSYVIVCKILEHDKKRLLDLAKKHGIEKNVIFTGYVSDKELNMLYNCCDVFLFPSLMEGFGLPILEAMQCGSAVIGSDSSSISELIEDPSYLFDPYNVDDMAQKITKMLKDPSFRQKSIEHSLQRCKDFSWNNVCDNIVSAIDTQFPCLPEIKKRTIQKPKIAFFTPLPPKKSGISYYSATLLKHLEKFWDIDIIVDEGYVCNDNYLKTNFKIFDYVTFEQIHDKKKYDLILYQFGNSDNHIFMFDMLKKYPGIVVLHDVFLSGVIHWMTAKKGKLDEFVDEVFYSHGEHGQKLVKKAQKNLIGWDYLIWNLTMNKRVIDQAISVIVHSDWDKKRIIEQYPELTSKIHTVHQFSPLRESSNISKIKSELGFSKSDFIICSFGFVVSTKKIDSILKNMKNFLLAHEQAKYVIVGELDPTFGESIKKLILDLRLQNKVTITGFINDDIFKKYLDVCDVCISLRTKTRAGTSASVNHSLGAGIPTIISDVEPFNEFPDDVALKLHPDSEHKLESLVTELFIDTNKRNMLKKRAKEYSINNLSVDSCIKKYVDIIATHL